MSVFYADLARALAARLEGVLPLGFTVQPRGAALVLSHSKREIFTVELRSSAQADAGLPPEMRVKRSVKWALAAAQQCVVSELGVPWPQRHGHPERPGNTKGADGHSPAPVERIDALRRCLALSAHVHTRVDHRELHMWFGDENRAAASLELDPIWLDEIIEPEPLASRRARTPISAEKLAGAIARRLQPILPAGFEVRGDDGDLALYREGVWLETRWMSAIIMATDDRTPIRKAEVAMIGAISGVQQRIMEMIRAPWPARAKVPPEEPELSDFDDLPISEERKKAALEFRRHYDASARIHGRATESGASFWFGEEHDPVLQFDPIGPEEYLEDA